MERSNKKKLLKTLTLAGCFSTGIIYGSIGVIALLSFFRLKHGGADESSFMVLLNGFLVGKIVNWLLVLGAVCFILWRFYEAFYDPYKVGNDFQGVLLRTGAAFSSGADAFIALTALQVLLGSQQGSNTGQPVQQRNLVADLLQQNWGRAVVLATGIIIGLTALVLVFYGLSKRFTERMRAGDFSATWRRTVHLIAYAGYLSRGVILGITRFIYIEAAVEENSKVVVNTDKAFDFIGDKVGHLYFILVAFGTICYGLYMFVLGLHYDIDADKKA